MPHPENCEHGFYRSQGCVRCEENVAAFKAAFFPDKGPACEECGGDGYFMEVDSRSRTAEPRQEMCRACAGTGRALPLISETGRTA